MNVDELNQARTLCQTEYDNLTNPAWLAGRINHLRGRYEVLTEIMNKEQDDAASATRPEPKADSNNDKGK